MNVEQLVIRADDPRLAELDADGWRIGARSWAARLVAADADLSRLGELVERGRGVGDLRELGSADAAAVLALDAATIDDYPGGVATQHLPLTDERALVSDRRRGFGVFDSRGRAIAVTYVDVDGRRAETDFTVVAPRYRGRGLGSAVKAASVLALVAEGVDEFRTGGSADNAASLAANHAVGYTVDEQWVTLARTGH